MVIGRGRKALLRWWSQECKSRRGATKCNAKDLLELGQWTPNLGSGQSDVVNEHGKTSGVLYCPNDFPRPLIDLRNMAEYAF